MCYKILYQKTMAKMAVNRGFKKNLKIDQLRTQNTNLIYTYVQNQSGIWKLEDKSKQKITLILFLAFKKEG